MFQVFLASGLEPRKLVAVAQLRESLQPAAPEDDGVTMYLDDGSTVMYGRHGEAPPDPDDRVDFISIGRPGPGILMDVALQLMRDFDYFLVWPGSDNIAAVANEHVRLPDEDLERKPVGSLTELLDLVWGS